MENNFFYKFLFFHYYENTLSRNLGKSGQLHPTAMSSRSEAVQYLATDKFQERLALHLLFFNDICPSCFIGNFMIEVLNKFKATGNIWFFYHKKLKTLKTLQKFISLYCWDFQIFFVVRFKYLIYLRQGNTELKGDGHARPDFARNDLRRKSTMKSIRRLIKRYLGFGSKVNSEFFSFYYFWSIGYELFSLVFFYIHQMNGKIF